MKLYCVVGNDRMTLNMNGEGASREFKLDVLKKTARDWLLKRRLDADLQASLSLEFLEIHVTDAKTNTTITQLAGHDVGRLLRQVEAV